MALDALSPGITSSRLRSLIEGFSGIMPQPPEGAPGGPGGGGGPARFAGRSLFGLADANKDGWGYRQ